MSAYILLPHPGHSRLFLDRAAGAAVRELEALLPGCAVTAEQTAGLACFRLTSPEPLSQAALADCARASLFYALFEERENGLLRPVEAPQWRYLPDSLNTILKYPGKTNEQFTRMLVNLAVWAGGGLRERPTLLDPMCGQGTTLFEAALRGWNAVGLEVQQQPVQKGVTYFLKFLETGRYKHKRSEERRTLAGKRIARAVTVEYAAEKDAWYAGDTRRLRIFHADSALCGQLLPKESCHLLACDLPYGVQHGSSGQEGLRRDASALVRACAPGWYAALCRGAGAALAYNTLTTPREALADAMEAAGFAVLPAAAELEHRVDQAISRDILLARKPK